MRAGDAFLLVVDHRILALPPNGHLVQTHDVTFFTLHEAPQLRPRAIKSLHLVIDAPHPTKLSPLFPGFTWDPFPRLSRPLSVRQRWRSTVLRVPHRPSGVRTRSTRVPNKSLS